MSKRFSITSYFFDRIPTGYEFWIWRGQKLQMIKDTMEQAMRWVKRHKGEAK